ncbi:manganese/zinc/iron transport system permease protein [Catalinimonas alkaloidigena]|uniref:metal ABC transporter permease n=1 Tax=Catalinimonas alkaloidigena TaxID=1075417 RepID=UPI002405E6FD|nr:iron chelate uptake ABC transporter family permease subunit [Catalinimonas alkaloidigena]MDF9795445.1 manganese/zinc/iron transport system permease protein [Catalinimonas alkaloidigena]
MDFLSPLQDPNVRWVIIAVSLICTSASVVGCFTFLRKRALIGDAIAHAILPGICLAFMIAQTKNPLILLVGAFVSGWLGVLLIDLIVERSKLKTDAALGLVLSVFYGIGILLLTIIQSSGNAAQSGLDKFLFGKAAAMDQQDVVVFTIFSAILLIIVIALFNTFKLISFDRDFALVKGFPVRKLEFLLSVLTVLAIAIGIQAVGVVLMAAFLITPAAAARYWTNKLGIMVILAVLFSVASGLLGTYVSYEIPRMPTGPWIVTVLTLFTFVSVMLGRRKGVLYNILQRQRNERKMLRENILKCLYHLGEDDGRFGQMRSFDEIQQKRAFEQANLLKGLKKLKRRKLVKLYNQQAGLTEKGIEAGARITRIHRLWELYLTQYMQLPADHVHEDAEAIEHIITPELEQELESQLAYPLVDPHDRPITYNPNQNG